MHQGQGDKQGRIRNTASQTEKTASCLTGWRYGCSYRLPVARSAIQVSGPRQNLGFTEGDLDKYHQVMQLIIDLSDAPQS